MSSITIRQANTEDFSKLAEIWLDASIKAHDFIPASYWQNNKIQMQTTYLPLSEVYLAEDTTNKIYGFIALLEHKIAAVFISPELQGQGIGKLLINYVKKLRSHLTLNVYQQNKNSVRFYESVGFKVLKETVDLETNSKEFLMQWEKDYAPN